MYIIIELVQIAIVLITSICILWKTVKSTIKVHAEPQDSGSNRRIFTVAQFKSKEKKEFSSHKPTEESDCKVEFGEVYIPTTSGKVCYVHVLTNSGLYFSRTRLELSHSIQQIKMIG